MQRGGGGHSIDPWLRPVAGVIGTQGISSSGPQHRDREENQNFHRHSRGWSYNRNQTSSSTSDRGSSFSRRNIPYNPNKRHDNNETRHNYHHNRSHNWASSSQSQRRSNRDYYQNRFSSESPRSQDRDNRSVSPRDRSRDRSPGAARRHYSPSEDEARRSYHRSGDSARPERRTRWDSGRSFTTETNPSSEVYFEDSSATISTPEASSVSKSEYENVVELANKITSLGPSLRDPRLIARVLKIQKQDSEISITTPGNETSVTLSVPALDPISSPEVFEEPSSDWGDGNQSSMDNLEISKVKEDTNQTLIDPRLLSPKRHHTEVVIKPVAFKPDPKIRRTSSSVSTEEQSTETARHALLDTPISPVKQDPIKSKELDDSILNEAKTLAGDIEERLKMPTVKSLSRDLSQTPNKSASGTTKDVSDKSVNDSTTVKETTKTITPPPTTISKVATTTTVSGGTHSLLKDSFLSKLKQEGRAKMTAPSKPETKQNQAILQMAFSPERPTSFKSNSDSQGRSAIPKQIGIKGILNKVMKSSITKVLRPNMDSVAKESARATTAEITPEKMDTSAVTAEEAEVPKSRDQNEDGEVTADSEMAGPVHEPDGQRVETEEDKNSPAPSQSPSVLERSDSALDEKIDGNNQSSSKHNKARKSSQNTTVVLPSEDTVGNTSVSSKTPSSKSDSKKSGKKNRRRHFRGSTYGLYLSSPKKKKKRPSKSPDGTVKYDDSVGGGTETTGSVVDSADEGSYRSDFQTSSEKSFQDDEMVRSSSEVASKPSPENADNQQADKFPIPASKIKKERGEDREPKTRDETTKIKEETMDVSSGTEVETEGEFDGKRKYSKEDTELLPTGEAAIPEIVPSNSDSENLRQPETSDMESPRNSIRKRHSVRANKTAGTTLTSRDGSSIALSVKSRQRIKRRTVDDNDGSYTSETPNNELTPKRQRRDQNHKVHAALTNASGNGSLPKLETSYESTLPPVIVCTCQTKPLDATKESANSKIYCQAIDSIDDKLIGCCNEVTTHHLVRPSVKIPFTAMCEVHLWRLKHHQCCPVCGIFCSQGDFAQCCGPSSSPYRIHLFHEECKIVLRNVEEPLCPHCGDGGGQIKLITLELNTPSASTFYLSQKPLFSEPRAKMTITRLNDVKDDVDEFPARSFQVPETGKVFSSAGLPVGADRSELEAMLVALDTEKLAFMNYTDDQLYIAAQNGEVENVLYMLALGFDPSKKYLDYGGDSALHGAAINGHLVTVHLLLQAGASIDQTNTRLYTPLMESIEKNQLLIVQYLIKSGAQLLAKGEDGMSALHLAARSGSLEICRVLLNTGKIMPDIQDDGGWTPVVWAAEHSHLEIVKLLIERGADTTIRDNEENIALHWSAFSGNVDISQVLLDLGCKLSVANEHGDTPLHIAARQNNYECVVLFLARGADVSVINKENETPIKCCADPNSQTYMALMMNSELKRLTKNRPITAERVMHKDISRGKEPNCIQCVNGVDEEAAPSDFLYIIKNCETSAINIDRTITSLQSCQCEDDCTSAKCTCATISFKCWYDNEGKLLPEFNMPDPPMIFECNQACLCWKNCNNRVLQHGILSRLQLFRTVGKGWGVRTLKDISRGTFICEYIGEIISDSEADQREDDSYLFDLDNRDGETYCLDARYYGNISRFINHLCEPNLVPVKIFVEHQDLSFPRIAFFSSRDIKAGEELGFDYGEKFWVIKYKCFTCACNSPNCKYSKDNIHQTLESYYKRLKEELPDDVVETDIPTTT